MSGMCLVVCDRWVECVIVCVIVSGTCYSACDRWIEYVIVCGIDKWNVLQCVS